MLFQKGLRAGIKMIYIRLSLTFLISLPELEEFMIKHLHHTILSTKQSWNCVSNVAFNIVFLLFKIIESTKYGYLLSQRILHVLITVLMLSNAH